MSQCDACLKPLLVSKRGERMIAVKIYVFAGVWDGMPDEMPDDLPELRADICYRCMLNAFGVDFDRAVENGKKFKELL